MKLLICDRAKDCNGKYFDVPCPHSIPHKYDSFCNVRCGTADSCTMCIPIVPFEIKLPEDLFEL